MDSSSLAVAAEEPSHSLLAKTERLGGEAIALDDLGVVNELKVDKAVKPINTWFVF